LGFQIKDLTSNKLEIKMKKIFALLFMFTTVVCYFNFNMASAEEIKPEPEQALGAYCCDGTATRRCVINPSPVGSPCYCNYQGWGVTCF